MQNNFAADPERRSFLKAGVALAAAAAPLKALGANDRVRVAVVGVRGRGWDHVKSYQPIPNVEVAAFCDIDESVLAQRVNEAGGMGLGKPKTYTDIRKLLEDKDIDAVSIATPNHWHSLMGIWAAQAGKDIYIEKPCSHNYWEGQQLVKAIEKYKVICEHGSQCRSSVAIQEAMEQMRGGLLGDVYMARGLCYKWRKTIGRTPPEQAPQGVHYDLWTGPAPLKQFTKNRFHYNWHWIWDTGNGDLGNQGIHELDLARWGLGVGLPSRVTAMGGHFLFDDDQETPNVINAIYEFDTTQGKKMINFEVRGWITNHEANIGTAAFMGDAVPAAGVEKPKTKMTAASALGPPSGVPSTIGNLYYGSKGYLAISNYDSYQSFLGPEEQPGPKRYSPVRNEHFVNFIECVRSRDPSKLRAPIIEGNLSAALIHLANASYRLGRTINVDPHSGEVQGDAEATALLRGSYRSPYVVPENV